MDEVKAEKKRLGTRARPAEACICAVVFLSMALHPRKAQQSPCLSVLFQMLAIHARLHPALQTSGDKAPPLRHRADDSDDEEERAHRATARNRHSSDDVGVRPRGGRDEFDWRHERDLERKREKEKAKTKKNSPKGKRIDDIDPFADDSSDSDPFGDPRQSRGETKGKKKAAAKVRDEDSDSSDFDPFNDPVPK